MSEEEVKKHWLKRPVGWGCAISFALGIFLLIFSAVAGVFLIEALIGLACGWFFFLGKNLTSLEWNFEMLACGVAALILATYGLHCLLVWLWKHGGWRVSWTISISALMLTLFGASIAMTGIIHQFGWMMREPFTQTDRRTQYATNVNNLKQHYYVLAEYDFDNGKFPETLEHLEKAGYVSGGRLMALGFDSGGQSPNEPWIYLGAERSTSDEIHPLPLMISPRPLEKGWVILRTDGTMTALPSAKLIREYPELIELLPNLIYDEKLTQ